ncbi:MAG: 16S rRNA (cytosine(967)-C(5))-methyltransferase RsmB [Clostridia bacterium]|nr:16S rRNA (cytosine(967)-C(5))-methyltransferase RsmB [Clostridia bacterium]
MINVRQAAYLSVLRHYKENRFSNLEIDSAIKKYGFTGPDRSLFTVIVYGSIERRITLDYYLSACSVKPVDSLDPEVMAILLTGAYQILFLDRVPDHAAVNEAVECAKKYKPASKGFVNAVLRKLISVKDSLELPSDRIKNLSVRYSMPEWIVSLWQEQYGDAEDILCGIDKPPTITLRTNTLVNTRAELMEKLGDTPCEYTETSPDGIHILRGISFEELEELCGNGAYVQDEASQMAVRAVDAVPGEFIIDTCCCPGGKTFGIAMCMENKGKVLALDLHKSKLSLVEKGANRLGIDIIETREHNSKNAIPEYIGSADRVLCDVPCSGLGVVAKKPETRYKNREDIARLPEIQYAILQASSSYLRSGGTLVYSTCTLNKSENENIVGRFISENSGYILENMTTYFPKAGKTDGFFVAKIKKTSEEKIL